MQEPMDSIDEAMDHTPECPNCGNRELQDVWGLHTPGIAYVYCQYCEWSVPVYDPAAEAERAGMGAIDEW